MAKEE